MGEWWALGQAEGARCVGRGEGMAEPPAQSGDWDGHGPHTAQRGFSLTVPGPGTQGGLGQPPIKGWFLQWLGAGRVHRNRRREEGWLVFSF